MSMYCVDKCQATIAEYRSPLHGNGIRATAPIRLGQLIVEDYPFNFLQSLPNKQDVVVCAKCSRFVGSLGLQMRQLAKRFDRTSLVDGEVSIEFAGDEVYSPIYCCQRGCGEIYCSEVCRDIHWKSCHQLVCTGHIEEDSAHSHPLIQFKEYAMATNEIFLLVADIIATALLVSSTDVVTGVQHYVSNYESFVRNLWWDVAIAEDSAEQATLQMTLVKMVNEAWQHLDRVFQLQQKGVAHILSPEFLARTIGMFEQNNIGVRLESPVALHVKQLTDSSETVDCILQATHQIIASLEEQQCCPMDGHDAPYLYNDENDTEEDVEDDGEGGPEDEETECNNESLKELKSLVEENGDDTLYPPLDGTAFYLTLCKINHSCDPNVVVKYTSKPSGGLVAQLFALRDIHPGEELVQCYIDNTLPVEERQKSLLEYGFQCTCTKCLANV